MGWLTTKEDENLRDKARRVASKKIGASQCVGCGKPLLIKDANVCSPKCAKRAAARW